MDWGRGYTSKYIGTLVDPDTWKDLVEIPIVDGQMTRDIETDLVESASVTITDDYSDRELLFRIYMIAKQEGSILNRVALFTGVGIAPTKTINGRIFSYSIDLQSVLKFADDRLLPLGWYASTGMPGAYIVRNLFRECGIQVDNDISNSPALKEEIVAESSESYLSMAVKIIKAIEWRIRIDGFGVVHIEPLPTTSSLLISSLGLDIIEKEITDKKDWYSCPNVLRITTDTGCCIIKDSNENMAARYSIPNRGREIWAEEEANLSENETVTEFAYKRLKELQKPQRELSYTRKFNPNVYVGDILYLKYAAQGIDGMFRVSNQNIPFTHGSATGETANEI
jgi:hypothetical protein